MKLLFYHQNNLNISVYDKYLTLSRVSNFLTHFVFPSWHVHSFILLPHFPSKHPGSVIVLTENQTQSRQSWQDCRLLLIAKRFLFIQGWIDPRQAPWNRKHGVSNHIEMRYFFFSLQTRLGRGWVRGSDVSSGAQPLIKTRGGRSPAAEENGYTLDERCQCAEASGARKRAPPAAESCAQRARSAGWANTDQDFGAQVKWSEKIFWLSL